ncbi:MAG: PadR family transcriptional regulator [Eubacteriales bacterium]|nr:PadR family transcriptional regulator [Eubacteriales bacterium]
MELNRARKRFIPMTETMFYILLSLRQPRHGYGIMQHVKELTGGRIVLGAGTIYQSLSKLEGAGLIESAGEVDRKKNYRITALGGQILRDEARRIAELYQNIEELL